MKKSDFSPQFSSIWGKEADGAHLTYPIPPSSGDLGRASLSLGFPPSTFVAPENGGSFVFGEDMNGILRMLAVSAQNYESGAWPVFSASFAQAIGGYPQDAVIADPAQADLYWRSTTDHNLTTPGENGAAWVSLLGDYLRLNTGDTQTISGPVTFSTAPLVPLLETGTRSDQTASTAWVGHELARALSGYLRLNTEETQTISGPVTFSTSPLVPLLGTGTRSDQTASTAWVGHELTHALGSYLRLNTGETQTVAGPVTFSDKLQSPYAVTDWTTNALPNAVTIATNFLSKSGNEQLSSSPTTFSNGLWSTATFYVSEMQAVGRDEYSAITLKADMRCGNNTLFINVMDVDGGATRTIFGATSITGAWNFGVRPTVVNTPVALTSDLPTPGGTMIQTFQVTASNGTWISYPTQFSTTPSHISVQVAQDAHVMAEFSNANGSGFRLSLSAEGAINLSILAVGPR